MEQQCITIRTYQRVFRLERWFYKIDRFTLPFPVTLRQILTFLVVMLAMHVLPMGSLPVLGGAPIFRYLGLPLLACWGVNRWKPDGKSIPRWLLSLAFYAVTPKRLDRFRPLPGSSRRYRMAGSAAWRAKPRTL